MILLTAKELVVGDIEISKPNFYNKATVLKESKVQSYYLEELYTTSWETIRNILRCMKKKYLNESSDNVLFERMLCEAKTWLAENKQSLNLF